MISAWASPFKVMTNILNVVSIRERYMRLIHDIEKYSKRRNLEGYSGARLVVEPNNIKLITGK